MDTEQNDIAVEPEGSTEVDVAEQQPVEQPNILDLEEYSDYHVQVGEDTLSLQELRDSGLRQADYTRKTQELAERGRELEQASTLNQMLQVNPRGTLEYLARQNGLSLADQQAAQQQQSTDDWLTDDYDTPSADPMLSRIAAIEERFQREDVDNEYRRAFDGLRQQFGDGFNEQEVAQEAYQRGIYDPSQMEMVANDLAYRKLRAAYNDANAANASKQAQETASKKTAAANAAAVTGSGGSASGTVPIPPQTKPLTTREAIEMAWDSSQ